MSRSKALAIEIGCLLVALFFYILGKLASDVFFIPAVIVMLGGMIVALIFNRCSCCGRWLGRHHMFIEYCPYCGNSL